MQTSLRPISLKQFVGQERLKNTLSVVIESSKKRKKQLDHILFHGKAGSGKTSLATIVANELGANIRYAQGPALDKKADILSLFASLTKGNVLFIDEIHGINKNIEELIYSALEDKVIDIVIGTEGDSKVVRMKLPDFTLIGATTKMNRLSEPFKDRFGITGKLVGYMDSEIDTIIKNSAKKMKLKISNEASIAIASRSRKTPRIANNFLKRTNDFATVKNLGEININIVNETFKSMGIYKWGLSEQHVEYLKCLSDVFYERSASLENISGIIHENKESIEYEIEPILIENGLITKSSRGRRITNKGIDFLLIYNL